MKLFLSIIKLFIAFIMLFAFLASMTLAFLFLGSVAFIVILLTIIGIAIKIIEISCGEEFRLLELGYIFIVFFVLSIMIISAFI